MAEFDLIVVGGGCGGVAAAVEAVKLGATVAVVEQGRWGGGCVSSRPDCNSRIGDNNFCHFSKLKSTSNLSQALNLLQG